MEISRRHLLGAGAGLFAAPAAAQIKMLNPFGRSPSVINPFGAKQGSVAPLTTGFSSNDAAQFGSTLINGLTPKFSQWAGHSWSVDTGSAWNPNMDYSWRTTPDKCRFELHNTLQDRGQLDPTYKRRAEIHDPKSTFLNGLVYWHAFTFLDFPWSTMPNVSEGTIMQMHWPSGASPAFAFRRTPQGQFRITTRGDTTSNTTRYTGALSFGVPHDVVYCFKLDGTNGHLDVWVDGNHVLSLTGVPIGSKTENGCYLGIGPYFGGGTSSVIVQEYANLAPFPSTTSLSSRVTSRPSWPTT